MLAQLACSVEPDAPMRLRLVGEGKGELLSPASVRTLQRSIRDRHAGLDYSALLLNGADHQGLNAAFLPMLQCWQLLVCSSRRMRLKQEDPVSLGGARFKVNFFHGREP